jgi:GntR family transcriptional regulator
MLGPIGKLQLGRGEKMTAKAVDRSSRVPVWRQLREDLLRRLAEGEFTGQFPGELALTRDYQVSRHTVRQALVQLRADGVVVAERGRQPRVAPPMEIEQPLGELYSLFASVEQGGQAQDSTVRALDVRADGVIASRLGLEESTPLVYLERLRSAGGEPLAVDRAWLPARIATPLLDADFTHTSLYHELSERAGVAVDHSREEIRPAIPTRAERSLLRCPAGVAAFSIHRLGHAQGRAVEWRHTLIRGDRFALTTDLAGASGYRLTW